MNRNSWKIWLLLPLFIVGCNSDTTPTGAATAANATPESQPFSLDSKQDKGVGPVTSLTLEALNPKLAKEGDVLFQKNCTACHRIEKRRVGPPLAGVTARRTPEWIMNMILNPSEMLEKNATAKELLAEYATQMANMNVTQEQARAILEYLRTKEDPHAKD